MSIIATTTQLLLLIISPLLQIALGQKFITLVSKFWKSEESAFELDEECSTCSVFVIGLLLYLCAVLVLKLIGLDWLLAAVLPYTPLFVGWKGWRSLFPRVSITLSANFVLWFFVILATGASLFQVTDGIQTPWRNNYGDLTWHLGMISSFVLGDNLRDWSTLPPQYHIYPGLTLSYPFFVNLWSASGWWLSSSWQNLKFIFLFEWVVLWTVVFFLLNGRKYWLLPWALFLGGGSYYALGQNSGEMIPKNIPWASFLTTIWVTQRSALLGACVALCALWMFHQALEESEPRRRQTKLFLSVLVLALSPLVHTHICLVIGIYCAVIFLVWLVRGEAEMKEKLQDLFACAAAALPSVLFLPWLVGKSHTVTFVLGWITGDLGNLEGLARLQQSLSMWQQGVWQVLGVFVIFWCLSRKHLPCLVLTILFLIANCVQLAVWDWDQLKVFLGLYIIFLFVWSSSREGGMFIPHLLLLVGMFPSAYECWTQFQKGESHTIYTKEGVEEAKSIELHTPPSAIIAAAPDHNSIITLTGRRLYYGYEGTLSSHGIPYEKRREIMLDLDKLKRCSTLPDADPKDTKFCPDFLLWTDAEHRYWNKNTPGGGLETTSLPFLYRIP